MPKANFLVSVFANDRLANSYYSEDLDDLVTIKALHRGCRIEIYDLCNFVQLTQRDVAHEVGKSGVRWQQSLGRESREESGQKEVLETALPVKRNKNKSWERRVMCVETGKVYGSIRKCSADVGIPYMTVVNCIKNGNATRGYHFIDVDFIETIETENVGK